jgi:ATP-dependent Clp protease ATP-binding subunit ClpC
LIGATTFDEYQKYIEKDPALKRRFQEIIVEEPSREDAIQILKGLKHKFEEYHGVNIEDDAIVAAVDLSTRYIMNKHLPDKAIDLLDEACARKSTISSKLKQSDDYQEYEKQIEDLEKQIEEAIQNQDYFKAAEIKDEIDFLKQKMRKIRYDVNLPKHLRPTITAEDIGRVLADKLGIPAHKVTQSEVEKIVNLEKILKEKVLGQDEVIDKVIDAIKRGRLSLVKRNKPIASFLFL